MNLKKFGTQRSIAVASYAQRGYANNLGVKKIEDHLSWIVLIATDSQWAIDETCGLHFYKLSSM